MPEPVVVYVYKASRSRRDEETPDLNIQAVAEFPADLEAADARQLHRKQGRAIGHALGQCLPQGTMDHLVVYPLERQASILRVTLEGPK